MELQRKRRMRDGKPAKMRPFKSSEIVAGFLSGQEYNEDRYISIESRGAQPVCVVRDLHCQNHSVIPISQEVLSDMLKKQWLTGYNNNGKAVYHLARVGRQAIEQILDDNEKVGQRLAA